MDYKSFLELVKKQNPDMPYKAQQKEASSLFAKFKKSAEGFQSGGDKTAPGSADKVLSGSVSPESPSYNMLVAAEKRLRSNVIDINSLRTIGGEVMPTGKVVTHGKEGVNTRVTYEDENGNRLPLIGYFQIWI